MFFGATDGPMTPEQMQQAPGKILHLPTVLGAVVPIYNLPGAQGELKFSGPLLADIFLGKITKWNDPGDCEAQRRRHAAGHRHHRRAPLGRLRHDLHLGRLPGEGVAGVEEERRRRTSVNWPVGLGGKGNEGVAGLVKQTPGSIGYVELIYAIQNKIAYGSVQNVDGEFVQRQHRRRSPRPPPRL